MVWYFHLFQNFPQLIVIHTVKVFGIVNRAEIDVFLELSCFFHDLTDVGNLISGSSVFSKTSLNIWNFTVCILLMPDLENFCVCVLFFFFFIVFSMEKYIICLQNSSWKIQEHRYYKTKQTPVMRHYIHHVKATV